MKKRESISGLVALGVMGGIMACGEGPFSNKKINKITKNSPLSPYTKKWDKEDAARLLRRCCFGYTPNELTKIVDLGQEKSIEELFKYRPFPTPPLNSEFEEDEWAAIGETWIDARYHESIFFEQYRKKSLRAWMMEVLFNEGISIREQLTLFWHNHFGVSDTIEHKAEYIHNNLLRKHAFGNARELCKQVAIETSMLRFLNGRDSTAESPNENFARELLELFTVGKGEPQGPGDYGTFTEQDVREIAKCMTGWMDRGWYSYKKGTKIEAFFVKNRHDSSKKRLSKYFGEAEIPNLGENEYAYVIDLIFQQRNTALHLCRKLYRWFVYHDINEEVEKGVISPLTDMLIAEDYELEPVLKTLLKSKHFHEVRREFPVIKNPLEYTVSTLRAFQVVPPENLKDRYNFWHRIFELTALMQMEYFKPPSVAGWKAFYQKPQYDKAWINASSLQYRDEFISQIAGSGLGKNGANSQIEIKKLLDLYPNIKMPEIFIKNITLHLFPRPLNEIQLLNLEKILLSGLSKKAWENEIDKYIKAVEGSIESKAMANRLRKFLLAVLKMPEYHLN